MGTCLSKKASSSSSSLSVAAAAATTSVSVSVVDPSNCKSNDAKKVEKITHTEVVAKKQEEEEGIVKKEIFVIKHRKSHDRDRQSIAPAPALAPVDVADEAVNVVGGGTNVVRTSSCTKEELDAILIQCGRLSRSNSSGKAPSSARKYSGSKRSYDFDHHDHVAAATDYDSATKSKDDDVDDDQRQHRQRHRQSTRPSSSSSQGRRRTPSREREQQQRSGSRERATSSGSGRRVSRSPGRRSENNQNTTTIVTPANGNSSTNVNRPGKMVSVPATVTSLVMDKSNNVEPQTTTSIKRISVKRNVGEGSRTAASPRSQSPARANARGSNENQQPSLSRSSSRKAEQSPYRRNPLSEIDPNSLAYPQTASNKAPCTNQSPMKKPNVENKNDRNVAQGTNYKSSSRSTPNNKAVNPNHTAKEQQQIVMEETKTQPPITTHVTMTALADSGAESLKPQTLTRSRSSRRSRDLDLNPETLLNPTPSYTTLLLEDIQNFHQKNTTATPSFSLPPCVTKACSILEAVADLNSTTSSNLSCAFSEDRKNPPMDPFVESEVLGSDDLMEPSFHKYVTVRRGGTLGEGDMEEQESSGSNSVVGGDSGQQHWGFSSSSWEPNSADSTDRWTSRSNTREEDQSPLGFQRHALTESGRDVNETRRKSSGKKRDSDHQHTGIGRGRIGSATKGLHTVPIVAAAAST